MEEKDYASEIFDSLEFDNPDFNITDFKSRIQSDETFLVNLYDTLGGMDETFKERMDGNNDDEKFETFKTRILDFSTTPKGKDEIVEADETVTSIDTDIPTNPDQVNAKYDDYLSILLKDPDGLVDEENINVDQTIALDNNNQPLQGQDLIDHINKVKSDKASLLDLVNNQQDEITYAQKLKDIQLKTIPTPEEIKLRMEDTSGEDMAIGLVDLNKNALSPALSRKFNDDLGVDGKRKEEQKPEVDNPLGLSQETLDLINKPIEFTSESGPGSLAAFEVAEDIKARETTKNLKKAYEDSVVSDKELQRAHLQLTEGARQAGYIPTSDKEKAESDDKYYYIPTIEKVIKDKGFYDIEDKGEGEESVYYQTSYLANRDKLAEEKLNSKEVQKELNEALEEFEGEKGVGAWNNVVNVLATTTPFLGGPVGKQILEQVTGSTLDEMLGMGETSREGYIKNQEELAKAIGLSQKGDDLDIAASIYNLRQDAKSLLTQDAALKQLQRKIETDPSATQEDVDRFYEIRNEIILTQKQIQANYKYLGDLQFEGTNVQDIIDKTKKSYDELNVLENIFYNSGVRIVTGLGALANEMNTVNVLEWAGIDLNDDNVKRQTVQYVTDILGDEGGAAVAALIETNVLADKSADEALKNMSEFGQGLLDKVKDQQSFDDIDGIESGLMWGTQMLTGQVLNTSMSIVIPGGGGLLISAASEAGNQMYDMKKRMAGEEWSDKEKAYIQEFKSEFGFNPLGDDDTYKVKPEEINALQFYGTAGIYGAAEYVSEKITLGNFKLGAKNLRKAFDLSKTKGVVSSNKINQRWINLRNTTKDYFKGGIGESFGEGGVTLSQNFAEKYILGNKDVSLLDGMTESMVSGFVMNNTMQSPAIAAQTYQAFRGPDRNARIAKRGDDILRLSNSIKANELKLSGLKKNSDSFKDLQQAIQLETAQLHELAKEQLQDQSKVRSEILTLTPQDRQTLINIFNKEHRLRRQIDKYNQNTAISPETANAAISTFQNELLKQEAIKKYTLGNAEWNADKSRAKKFADNFRAKNGTQDQVEMIVGDNNNQALENGLAYVDTLKDLTKEEKNQVKEQMKMQFDAADKASIGPKGEKVSINGFAWGDDITVETTQPDGTKSTRQVNVPMTFALNRNNLTVQSHEIGHHTLFKEFMRDNPDAVGLVNDLEAYIKKNYSEAYDAFLEVKELYGEYDSKGELTNAAEVAEEKLAALSDFMRQNNLEGMRTLHNKLFGRFNKFNDGSGQIRTGKDVFDMLVSYNESFERGELTGLTKSIAEGTVKFDRKSKKPVNLNKTKPNNTRKSLTKAERDNVEDTLNEIPGPKGADGNYLMNKKDWQADKDRALSKAVTMAMDGTLDGLIVNKMATGDTIHGLSRDEFMRRVYTKLGMHVFNFNPQSSGSLFGWINSYIGNRVGDVSNQAKRQKVAPGPTVSTSKKIGDKGERTVAETIKGDDADTIIAAVDATMNKQDVAIDNLRTRLGIEKGGPLYNKVVAAVQKTFGRTKLKDVSNIKFKQDLKNKFNTELFKAVKNSLGTRAAYKNFIEGDVVFKNKDGKEVKMPRIKMLFDYFAQEVFNKRFEPFKEKLIDPSTGKQARPENNPLFRKRDNITKKELVDYFLGSDVQASTKGTRKDALASAIAQELAFDATMEVLEDPNIQNKIKDFYELQGLTQAVNFTEKVGKIIDRKPGSKFSKTKIPGQTPLRQDQVIKEFNKLEQFLSDKKGSNIKDVSELIENYINKQDKNIQLALREYASEIKKAAKDGKVVKIAPTKAQQKAIAKSIELINADVGTQLLAEQKNWKQIPADYGFEAIDVNTNEGRNEAIEKIFMGVGTTPPLINFLPESAMTSGTFSNGGLNKNLGGRLSVEQISKLKAAGIRVKATEPVREYTLTDGTKIKNTDPDFTKKETQLKIAPVTGFLFANRLQIDNAIKLAKQKDPNAFAPENSNIENAVTRQGYTSKLLKEMKQPGFFDTQTNKRQGVKDLMFALDKAVQFDKAHFLPVVTALLSSTSGSQGHLGRTGSIVEFTNTLDSKNVEEHTQPASDLMKFFVNRMAQGNLDMYIDPALDQFFQGALPLVFDKMLKGVGPDGVKFDYTKNVPSEFLADVLLGDMSVWVRYFNPNVNSQIRIDENTGIEYKGIDPNTIILSNGNSIAKEFGLEVSESLINPDTVEVQQKLIYEILTNQVTQAEARKILEANLPITKTKFSATKANENMINNSGVMYSKGKTNKQTIDQANTLDKALDVARDPNAPVKKIRVFDFDDTLATSKNIVFANKGDQTIELNAEEFAKRGLELKEDGWVMDFSDFNRVTDGGRGPLFEVAQKIKAARGNEDLFVLTARAPESQQAIYDFLKSQGLEFKKENIIGLGNSTGAAKAQWIVGKAAEGYNDFYFADDAIQNVKAVKDALSVIDVKSQVQQAKMRFSKTVDQTVNDMLEHKFGIKSEAEYSDVKARLIGRKKGKFKLFIPPSAEDFVGLLYSMLGKGEVGNMQMDFFKEHLIEPYGRAMENLSRDQNRIVNDFKVLKDQLVKEGLIPKNLNKKAFDRFTVQDVARILAWNKQGLSIPGISKTDLKQILKYAKDNPAIDVFAQNLIDINKGDGYAAPNENWLAGTISTDLLDGLRTGKRSKYLKQWRENVDLIFSPKNLNKMEAAMGSRWREAMEDMLRRMESGQNRSSTAGRLENRLLDYINNSIGTVMFFNMRSALLQTISSINFIDFGSNNIFKAAGAFANQKQYWKDFITLMNSEFLIERRNGLKLNVSESEIADAAATSKNKAKAAIAYILKKGYLPTQFADSFAIASGGATFYRNKIKSLMKNNPDMTLEQAEKQAFQEFREIAEESQQSSRPDRISQQQASTLGRLILAFQNTPMQMNRLGKKSFQDLVNRRKRPGMTQFQSDMSNISRVGYYMAVQSLIFSSLQQALFALAFDDEEPEDEKERYYNVANGVINTILNGTGILGVSVSTLISVARKVYKESAKEGTFPGPAYEDAANEMLNFSPPIDIKLSKLRQGGLTWKYEGYKHDEAKWGIDDPAWKSAAYVISGLTNVPLDRLLNKAENVRSAVQDDWETWQRVSLLLGWSKYQIQSKEAKAAEIESQKEAKAAFRKRIKASKTRTYYPKKPLTIQQQIEKDKKEKDQKEFDKYKKMNKPRQVQILDSLGLTKKQIRNLKYEKDRVAKIIQLMNK
jgi:hypothetical protein